METLYLVLFLGGTGGNFIEQLISMILNGKSDDIVIANDASAHAPHVKYRCRMSPGYFENYSNIDKAYKHIDIEYSEKYGIILDHIVPNWNELFSLYPNTQVIVITVPEKNLVPRITGNLYFKTVLPESMGWLDLKSNTEFSIYNSPDDVPDEILKRYFYTMIDSYDDLYGHPFNGKEKFDDPRIHTISYYDMLYNPSIVLDTLSKVTNKDIPPGLMTEYQKYLDAQDKLVREKMSWINDR